MSASAESRYESQIAASRPPAAAPTARVLHIGTLLAVVIGTCAAVRSYGNLDVSWFLYAAGRLLEGARLYRDIFDINPPLVIYLGAPAAALSRVSGVPDIVIFNLMVCVVAAGSLGLLHRTLSRAPYRPAEIALVVMVAATALFLLPVYHFGQREHLLTIALLPYLFLTAARIEQAVKTSRTSWLIGAMAGLGIALKPQFAPALLLVHGWSVYRGARLVPAELASASIVVLGYLLITVVAADGFFTFLPFGARYYPPFAKAPLMALLDGPAVPVVLASGWLALIVLRHKRDARVELLTIVGLLALAVAIAQQKAWSYHYYPALAFSTVAAGVSLVGHRYMPFSWLRRTVSAGALVLIGLLAWGAMRDRVPLALRGNQEVRRSEYALLAEMLAQQPGTIASLSNTFEISFPLVNRTGARWVLPMPSLWPLPGIIAARSEESRAAAQARRDERWFRNLIVTALVENPPRVLIVDEREDPAFGNRSFDFIAYLVVDPRFAALIPRYRRAAEIGGHAILELVDGEPSADL